jgi:hypothetical protein
MAEFLSCTCFRRPPSSSSDEDSSDESSSDEIFSDDYSSDGEQRRFRLIR